MWKKVSFGIFITCCIAAGIYWFAYIREIKTPVREGINAIPTNAAIVFESRKSLNTWKKLSQTNIMWEELLGTATLSKLNTQCEYIDSLLNSHPSVASLLDEHPAFASIHPAPENSFELLFIYSLPNITYTKELEQFFTAVNNNSSPVNREYGSTEISVITPKNRPAFHYSFVDGILIMSASSSLVELSIRQLASGTSLADNPNFKTIQESAGKKVDLTIYANYRNLPEIFNGLFSNAFRSNGNSLSGFADCSGWDVTIKPNSLMLSGFTHGTDSSAHFLDLFLHQKARTIELTKALPANTAFILFYGISNMRTFQDAYQERLKARNEYDVYKNRLKELNSLYHLDVRESITGWIENEMALVITEHESDLPEHTYAVIRSNNISLAQSSLRSLAESVNRISSHIPDSTSLFNPPARDTITYKGHFISRITIKGLLPAIFGNNFKDISENYYCVIDNYIVFGNSRAALQNFIKEVDNNKTLANDKNYQAFAENISAESNLFIYSAMNRSLGIYKNHIDPELAEELIKKKDLLHKFEAMGIQFSTSNKAFYSNIYLKYNPAYKQESGTLWECALDTSLSTKPYTVINHKTKAKEILVQDDANKIYLISNTGKVIWTKQLHEKIMSDVIQVDVFKNNKLQMIFNTRSFIYMFDRNGNEMKGFPIRLRSPATNPIAVIDYDKNHEYRIFIATENKRIVCYQANGEQLTGFRFDKTEAPVYLSLQYFKAANKDHLCAVDVKGKIYILNRQGETRITCKEEMPAGMRIFFTEPGKDYSRSFLVGADTLGNVIRLALSGDKETIRCQEFETTPFFDYKDLNNDKTKEYIFLTRNELKVFSQDKSLLFRYEFNDTISEAPLFFLFPDGSAKIGVVSGASSLIYLFNPNGSLPAEFPLNGKTPFSIADLNNEGHFNLVTGSQDNSIYVYQLR